MRFVSLAAASLAAVVAGCSSSTVNPPQPQLGGSSSFGLVTIDGRQKMYLPLPSLGTSGHAQLAVVDVAMAGNGTAGAKALLKIIDLGSADQATTVAGAADVVVAASAAATTVWFVDPHTDTVEGTTSLPAGATMSTFSGGGGYVTGIIVDHAKNTAILAVGDGFLLLDLATRKFGAHIQAPPAENFGFDATARRIVAPFYDCPPALAFCASYKTPAGAVQGDGLTVIDLNDSSVSQFRLGASPPPGPSSDEPVGGEPDAAAVDGSSGVAAIPSETDGTLSILDLRAATFDRTAGTFTAPQHTIASPGFEGVGAEPTGHFAFFENRFSTAVAIVNLNDANGGNTSGFLTGSMPDLPGGPVWSNAGDPHAIVAVASYRDGRPVGLLVNFEGTWVARVDLATMAGATHATPGVLTAVELAPAVTYLDLSP